MHIESIQTKIFEVGIVIVIISLLGLMGYVSYKNALEHHLKLERKPMPPNYSLVVKEILTKNGVEKRYNYKTPDGIIIYEWYSYSLVEAKKFAWEHFFDHQTNAWKVVETGEISQNGNMLMPTNQVLRDIAKQFNRKDWGAAITYTFLNENDEITNKTIYLPKGMAVTDAVYDRYNPIIEKEQ